MMDFMLYKEALAASGYTIIKTDELESLRESEPKKIKRLRTLIDMLKLENDRLNAELVAVMEEEK